MTPGTPPIKRDAATRMVRHWPEPAAEAGNQRPRTPLGAWLAERQPDPRRLALAAFAAACVGICVLAPRAQHAGAGGGLLDSRPVAGREENTTLQRTTLIASTVALTTMQGLAPAADVVVADSVADFAGTQGSGGWSYLYDRGAGTSATALPYFITSVSTWAAQATPPSGFANYVMIMRDRVHPNSAGNCNGSSYGLERPIRRWSSPQAITGRASISIQALGSQNGDWDGIDAELHADGVVIWVGSALPGSSGAMQASIPLVGSRQVQLVIGPHGNCASDNTATQLTISSVDCDSNGVADSVDIASGSAIDVNANGWIDSCECAANPASAICCIGDILRDGRIDGADLAAVLSHWGAVNADPVTIACDLDHSGNVDGNDLGMLLAHWGPCGP